MIQQSPRTFDGNKKGLFTRERQPKAAARVVRQRYLALAKGQNYHPDLINSADNNMNNYHEVTKLYNVFITVT